MCDLPVIYVGLATVELRSRASPARPIAAHCVSAATHLSHHTVTFQRSGTRAAAAQEPPLDNDARRPRTPADAHTDAPADDNRCPTPANARRPPTPVDDDAPADDDTWRPPKCGFREERGGGRGGNAPCNVTLAMVQAAAAEVAQHLGPRRVRSRTRVEGWGRVKVLLNSLMPADAPADVRRYSTTTVTPYTRPTPLPSPPPYSTPVSVDTNSPTWLPLRRLRGRGRLAFRSLFTRPHHLSTRVCPAPRPRSGTSASRHARTCGTTPIRGRRRRGRHVHPPGVPSAASPLGGAGAAAAAFSPPPSPSAASLSPLALSSRACPAPCVPLGGAGVAAATFTPSLSTS